MAAPENIRYDACVSCDQDITPTGEVCWDKVEGELYAVFMHQGAYEDGVHLTRFHLDPA